MGETPDATKSALSNALAALLGALVGEACSCKCATELFYLLARLRPPEVRSESTNSLLSCPGDGASALPLGHSLLTSLIGSKATGVANFLATRSGIREVSAFSILEIAATLLVGSLGKLISSRNLGATAFGNLLRSQPVHLQGLIPQELERTLGIHHIIKPSRDATELETLSATLDARVTLARSTRELPLKPKVPLRVRIMSHWRAMASPN